MTGGQAQIDAETKLAGHAHGRLESLLRGARTDECRGEIITAYQRYMGAQALVSEHNKQAICSVLFCFEEGIGISGQEGSRLPPPPKKRRDSV